MLKWPFIRIFSKPKPKPQLVPVPPQPSPTNRLLRVSNDFAIDTQEWASCGDRDAILAASGFGKSYLAGVLTEEILENGGQVVIIDPEGENHTLAERYPILLVGGDKQLVNLDLGTAERGDINRVMETVLDTGVSVIFDLSERTPARQRELFTMVGSSLLSAMDRLEKRRPIKLIVEEARIFAPQSRAGLPSVDGETCLSVFENIATRGRKRGINMLLATQRPASISKDILSQCNRWWFGGMQSTQDCNALKPYLEEAGVTADDIKTLPKGEGWFYYHANGQTHKIKTRKRKCKHGGSTPMVQAAAKPASKADVSAALTALNCAKSL